jgi:MFS family permease
VPVLWITFAMLAAIGTLSYNFGVTLPLFVTGALHSSEGTFTVLYSIFSLGSVVGALVVAHRGLVRLRHIILGAAALGVTTLLLAAVPSVEVAVPAVFLVGTASILYLTGTTAIVQVEARPEMHGRVLSLQSVVLIGTVPVGGPFLGWLADTLGGRAPLLAGGIVSLLAAGFGWWAGGRSAGQLDLDDRQRPGGFVAVADGEGEGPGGLGWRRPEAELVDPE